MFQVRKDLEVLDCVFAAAAVCVRKSLHLPNNRFGVTCVVLPYPLPRTFAFLISLDVCVLWIPGLSLPCTCGFVATGFLDPIRLRGAHILVWIFGPFWLGNFFFPSVGL